MPSYGVCAAFAGKVPEGASEPLRGNPDCHCYTAMQAMYCPEGHMLECHAGMDCQEAECEHYLRETEADTFDDEDGPWR